MHTEDRDEDAGLEEYGFLHIERPLPSRNWRRGGVRWTNIILVSLVILLVIGSLALVLYAAHVMHQAWKTLGA